MRTALALALVTTLSIAAQMPQPKVIPRPDPSRFTVQKDLPFGENLKFDLYRPAGSETVPIAIFGNVGYTGMKNWPGYVAWGEAVAGTMGMAAVHYDATRDKGVESFDALMTALRARAAADHLDPSRVVLWSGSSNVMLGLPVAMDAKRDYIRGAVVYYGDAPVTEFRLDLPVFYARAGRDVPQLNQRIEALAGRAMVANAPWTLVNVPAGTHGFDGFDDDDVARSVVLRTLEFMRAVTTPAVSQAYIAAAVEAGNAAAFARGDWDAAVVGYRKRVAAYPTDGEGHRRLGLALTEKQQFADALTALERAYQLGRGGVRDTQIPAAVAAAGAGNADRAAYWLDKALSSPFGGDPASYRTDPRFAKIANDAAFVAVIEKHKR